jgi:hypothetical protein
VDYACLVHPLTTSVPDVEVPRSDVVAARIARKVGPLFGIVWEQSPFACTWVCDFGAITLAEIARGAPYPARDVQAALDTEAALGAGAREPGTPGGGAAGSADWRLAGRAVWTPRRGPTPGAISHATLNRYGPDTKAAVVLTGANRLLRDVTAAIARVCRSLADQHAAPEIRLAVWASLVLEAFRGQPALVAAAVQARAIQRALTTPWGEHLWLRGLAASARCEFGTVAIADREAGNGAAVDSPQSPTRFELVDATLPLLRLPIPVTDGPLLTQAEILDDIASRWCHRLLQVGHPGRGITWVAADPPGHRRVQSYVRIGSAVAPFVAEVLAVLSIADGAGTHVCLDQVSELLSGSDTAGLGTLARRAHLVSAHALTNYLRFHDGLLLSQPQIREATRELCDRAAAAAAKWLGQDDPASLLLAGYAAYLHAWDLGREPTADLVVRAAAATELVSQLDKMAAAWRDRLADPGTASYLLEVGAMALDRLRVPGFSDRLPELWRTAMLARGIDPDSDLDDPLALPAPQQYHLQNYAAFLASTAESAADLRRALAAQRACVRVRDQVTHGELAVYGAKFTSARTSSQAAAAIASRLLRALDTADRTGRGMAEYREVLAEGVAHARAAIENPTTAALLGDVGADAPVDGRDGPEAAQLAIAVLPVIVAAWEYQRDGADGAATLVDDALLAAADALLAAAAGSASRLGPALSEADRAILADLRRRRGAPTRAASSAA